MMIDPDTGLFWISFYCMQSFQGRYLQAYRNIGNFSSNVFPHPGPRELSVSARVGCPFTPYYMTRVDGRNFIGMIHRRSGIYSWTGEDLSRGRLLYDEAKGCEQGCNHGCKREKRV